MGRVSAEASALEELREIAKSYYDSATPQVQEKAKRFFRSMDLDQNGRINLEEFLSFMRQEGYKQMRSNSFFKMLDTSGRGALAFMDVITLYYIIKSGRPFCDSCGHFIPGTFFSCVACFNHPKYSFNVCSYCHLSSNKNYRHKHDGRSALFLDNYTLLQATKPRLPTTANQAAQTKPTGSASASPSMFRGSSASASPSMFRGSSASASASTSMFTDVTGYMTTELYKGLSQSPSTSYSHHLKHSPSVNVSIRSTTSTHNTIRESRPNQHAIVPATQQVSWMKVASVAFKALDAMVVIGNVVGVVPACTIL